MAFYSIDFDLNPITLIVKPDIDMVKMVDLFTKHF